MQNLESQIRNRNSLTGAGKPWGKKAKQPAPLRATHEIPNSIGGLFNVAIIADDGGDNVEVQVAMKGAGDFNGWRFVARRCDLRPLKSFTA